MSFNGGFGNADSGNQGYGYGGDSGHSFRGRRDDDFSRPMDRIDWNNVELVPFEKKFYIEHPDVASMSQEEAERIRRENDIVVMYNGIPPKPIRTFMEGGFPDYLLQAISKVGFSKPTAIQIQGWPIALSGHDMIGIAETGSGKTCAFLLPAILHIMAQPELKPGDGPIMLCLAPTRELTNQIAQECERFGGALGLRSVALYGGAPKNEQARKLRGVEMVVACPGRLIDMLRSNMTNLRRVTYLVLDEADRMLDMGFEEQIRSITSQIRPDRQTLMWSATWPREVSRLARDLCREDPIKINVGSHDDLKACENVTQFVKVIASEHQKNDTVLSLIDAHGQECSNPKIIIFSDRKRDCDELADACRRKGISSGVLHGDRSQDQRDAAMDRFRRGIDKILIATDVASRGLDVKDITCVINKDFPKETASYIHRIGRTGRAGAKGVSYVIMTPENYRSCRDLIKILQDANQQIPRDLIDLAEGRWRPSNNDDFPGNRGAGFAAFASSSGGYSGGGSASAGRRDFGRSGGDFNRGDDRGSFGGAGRGSDGRSRDFDGRSGGGFADRERSGGRDRFGGDRSDRGSFGGGQRERSRERGGGFDRSGPSFGGSFGNMGGGFNNPSDNNRERSRERGDRPTFQGNQSNNSSFSMGGGFNQGPSSSAGLSGRQRSQERQRSREKSAPPRDNNPLPPSAANFGGGFGGGF
eukprot:GDKJ01042907.1.p1 GENE.GDKJ01042907.1~~GDKJ01042907.1.p1  ORF type:complete len:700 (-),score=153.54 GDKJ01042907.1:1395-3494(-)